MRVESSGQIAVQQAALQREEQQKASTEVKKAPQKQDPNQSQATIVKLESISSAPKKTGDIDKNRRDTDQKQDQQKRGPKSIDIYA